VKLTDMADHVHLSLELGADGDEPVGSLGRPGTGHSRRFWGWLEFIEAVEECIRQLCQADREEANREEGPSPS
jgi:hypothetical protein